MRVFSMVLVVGFVALPSAAWADERRQLGAHEHGTGRLTIAIETSRIAIELDAPGADIFGFETEKPTAEQKAVIKARLAQLRDAAKLFPMPAAAGCVIAKATAGIEGATAETHAGHGHSHNHGKAAQAKEEAKTQTHADVTASYTFTCKAPSAVRGLKLGYFEMFPGAEKLDVAVAGPKGQTQVTVVRAKPTLDLSAAN